MRERKAQYQRDLDDARERIRDTIDLTESCLDAAIINDLRAAIEDIDEAEEDADGLNDAHTQLREAAAAFIGWMREHEGAFEDHPLAKGLSSFVDSFSAALED